LDTIAKKPCSGRQAMTAGAVALILFATVPWVVWVVIYYLRNRKEERR
jgi:hypothetical protein